jgi:hypothetical protein
MVEGVRNDDREILCAIRTGCFVRDEKCILISLENFLPPDFP